VDDQDQRPAPVFTRPLTDEEMLAAFEETIAQDDQPLTDEELAMIAAFQSDTPTADTPSPAPAPGADFDTTAAGENSPPLTMFDTGATQPILREPSPTPTTRPATPATPLTSDDLDYIPPAMRRLFVIEAAEELERLHSGCLALEQRPDNRAALLDMERVAHRVKGTAGILGFDTLAQLALTFEDVLKAIKTRRVAAGPAAIATLFACLDLLQAALSAASAERDADPTLPARADELLAALLLTAPVGADGVRPQPAEPEPPALTSEQSIPSLPPEISEVALTARNTDDTPLQVEVRRVDALMNRVSQLTLGRAALLRTRDEIARLQAELEQLLARVATLSSQITDSQPPALLSPVSADPPSSAASADQSAPKRPFFARLTRQLADDPHKSAHDALELERYSEFDTACRALSEAVDDVRTAGRTLRERTSALGQTAEQQAALTESIQHDVLRMRLVSLEPLALRLRVEVRRLAGMLKKQVSFTVAGELTEIDRNISDALREPLIQLVRNALIHGIEPPDERREIGKPTDATLTLRAFANGDEVVIELGDDGRGVNAHRLAASAVANNLLDGDAARSLTVADALDLMFLPGVSTYAEAQVIGGRGMGMDEVRATIRRLKGSIEVHSEPDQGTTFRIRVPISLSVVRALQVQAGEQVYALPFTAMRRMLSLTPAELLTSVTRAAPDAPPGATDILSLRVRMEREQVGGPSLNQVVSSGTLYEEVPAYYLAHLLGFEQQPTNPQAALLVEMDRTRCVLLVDAILDEREMLIQALPKHLRRRVVQGATVTARGDLLLLLDAGVLLAATSERHSARPIRRARPPTPAAAHGPHVLVVDDSISIRKSLELTLTHAGYDVQLARDGIEALELMLVNPPQVMVLDIEMPRLDGFELLAIMRGTPQLAGVRTIMLTSRAADKHRAHASALGAAAYLIKPCPQETLLETIRTALDAPVENLP
jgi:chemosensory pili system protein ChpA (sensor histidine kinase/response regulator)